MPEDILFDDSFKPIIKNGDFVIGDCTQQCQNILLLLNKGEMKQIPIAGVGIKNYLLEDANPVELQADIQNEFESDGMSINKLLVNDFDDIQIDAEYAR